jgi:hypothetical protein
VLSTPEGRAWGILLTAFILFCILAITVPFTVRWHLINATHIPETALKPIQAAVRIRESENTEFLAVTHDRDDIVEGTVIATDEHSRGFVRLFENSTLTLYNDTELLMKRVRTPRYRSSSRSNEITIQIRKGRVAIGAAAPAPPDERALQLTVQTPHASVTLEEGRYSVLVDSAETQVTVLLGKATIDTGDETQTWRNGRCRVVGGTHIDGPLPPEQNLIVNGNFDAILGSGWQEPTRVRQDPGDLLGEAGIAATNEKTMLSFKRLGARTHGEQSTIQFVDKDVRDFSSLKFGCEIQVNYQSLAGGGYESTEFPIMIELKYKDAFGDSRSRYWGFYYLDPGTGPEWKTMINGIKVVQGEWYLFESDNLMQTMGELAPVYIESIRIYASGWDFDSAITGVSLQVKE